MPAGSTVSPVGAKAPSAPVDTKGTHVLATQSPPAQVVPHAPQLAGSLVMSTQAEPQWVKPAAQVNPQEPPVQVADAWAGGMHTVPHPPQLAMSVLVLTSQPLPGVWSQSAKPA